MKARFTQFSVVAAALLLPVVAGAQARTAHPDIESGAYVISAVGEDASCREATPAEATILNQRPGVPTMVFGENRSRIRTNDDAPQGLNIILRGTTQLDANPEAKAAFERAAAIWESRIANRITVYVDVDFGPKRFGKDFPENVIASAGTPTYYFGVNNDESPAPEEYPILRELFAARADSTNEAALYSALPETKIPTDEGDLIIFGGGVINMRALAWPLPDFAAVAKESDPAPTIGFNSAFEYDFNPDDGIQTGRKDFVAVVVHEIGHMLGFSSRVGALETGAKYAGPSVMDLFRFRPGVDAASFSTAQRILKTTEVDQVFFAFGKSLALSTGNPSGENGDSQQASHWKDDSKTSNYIGIMDPTLPSARRVELTRYDLEALDTIGYQIASPGCAELEPNDLSGDANAAGFDVPCTGTAGKNESYMLTVPFGGTSFDPKSRLHDLFKVTLPAPARLNVSLAISNTAANLDVFLLNNLDATTGNVLDSSIGTGPTEQFESDTLAAGTYYIGVAAADGVSPYTLTVTPVGLPPAPPAAPSGLTASGVSATNIELTWADNSTNETEFLIEQRFEGADFVEIGSVGANATGFTVSNVEALTTTTYRVRARNEGGFSAYSAETSATTPAEPGPCVPNATTACLNSDRFKVSIDYLNQFANPPAPGTLLTAKLLPGAQNPDTATFGFGSPQAVEVVVRIQDARPFGAPRFDIYYGGMTDVEYTVTVIDTVTGTTRRYKNPAGTVGGGVDRTSFPTDGSFTTPFRLVQSTSPTSAPIVKPNVTPAACVPGPGSTCLLSDRFQVKIDYLNQFANPPAPGTLVGARLLSGVQNPDTGIFGFANPQAIEVVVRIQDARIFGLPRFDIYYGGMTDVEYTVTVTDTVTGRVRQYRNPPGTVGGGVDRASFTAN